MTSLIFHYISFSVTMHIYTCRSIHKPQSINPGLEHTRSSLDQIYKILGAKNHRTPKPCANSCTKHGWVHLWVGPHTKKNFVRALPRTPTVGSSSSLVTSLLRSAQRTARGASRGKTTTHTQHWHALDVAATYSAFSDDSVTMGCFLHAHEIKLEPRLNT